MKIRLSVIEMKLKDAEGSVGKKPDSKGKAKLLLDARYNFFMVKQSPGIHNVGYALKLLDVAEKKLNVLLGITVEEITDIEMEGEILWFRDTEGLDPVRFDHFFHQSLFPECVDCHDSVFPMEKGSSDILGHLTMSNMNRGKFCGACHDGETSESINERCEKCHQKAADDS